MEQIKSHRTEARLFGIFFIITFLSYGIGSGLVEALISAPDMLAAVHAKKEQLVLGVILMAVVHTVMNVGLAVIMSQILGPQNRYVALGYYSAAVIATVILVVGAIFLAMLVPLSDAAMAAESHDTHDLLGLILGRGGFYAYQIGMTIWGLGGLLLCWLLYRSVLVPRVISLSGAVGYLVFVAGTLAELFGNPIGLYLSIPGGLFEITLSLWLILSGFNMAGIAAAAQPKI